MIEINKLATQLWHNVEDKPTDFVAKVGKRLEGNKNKSYPHNLLFMREVGQSTYANLITLNILYPTRYCKGGKATRMQGVGEILKIIYKLQSREIDEECKPNRLSWATYNALERKKGERVLHHHSWMLH
jgi:hypothetical protein